jgi:RNA polymerase sigma-70 factor (ECF subfamily)
MSETLIHATNVDPISPRLDSYDLRLLTALRQGDEAAFVILVNQHHTAMVRLAMTYVPNRGVAEEVAQEAWLGVLRGLDRFEGRSSLKTWIFRILVNRAKTRGQRESRSIPLTALWDPQGEPDEVSVDPERFLPADHPRWAHHWASFPESWDEIPEERILHQEIRTIVEETIEKLPPNQRQVITLRDIDGWTAKEVCNVLQISETNQRVLLHRARSKVRGALEQYLMSGEDT